MTAKPATPLPMATIFRDSPSPVNAVRLAMDDHRAGPLTDWPYIDELRKAETICLAYPQLVEDRRRLVEALRNLGAGYPSTVPSVIKATALLAELGEAT